MEDKHIEFKEAIELFIISLAYKMQNENSIPKVNIIFPETAYTLFEYVKDNPFIKEGYYTSNIQEKDIENLKSQKYDENIPTITVKDPVKFFNLLTEISNYWIDQKDKNYWYSSARLFFNTCIIRLWLRMTPNDFNNVEAFLERQLNFFKSTTFDDYLNKDVLVGEFNGYQIKAKKDINNTYCETNERMKFTLYDSLNNSHTLPSVFFAIEEQEDKKICYIYAIQNEREKNVDKNIARSLYQLNAGIESPNVHPSQVLALKTFIEMLKSIGVTEIKVPAVQVLSHSYHSLQSEKAKSEFPKKYTQEHLNEMFSNPTFYEYELEEYELDKIWYNHIVDREDDIEKAKTEGLFNIFYRVAEQFENIEILNEPFIQDEYLNLKIKNIPQKTI